MMKRLLPVLFALQLAACAPSPGALPTPDAQQAAGEEQAVYTAVLASLYDAPAYVLLSTTATDPVGVENTAEILAFALDNLPGVLPETGQDFLLRNADETALAAGMQIGAPYVLLTRQEMSDLFSENQNGWEVFYLGYPDAPGITSLSRVGFNPDMTQALVYVGTQSHWLAGSGTLMLLEKVDGGWTVRQQVMTWIS